MVGDHAARLKRVKVQRLRTAYAALKGALPHWFMAAMALRNV